MTYALLSFFDYKRRMKHVQVTAVHVTAVDRVQHQAFTKRHKSITQ